MSKFASRKSRQRAPIRTTGQTGRTFEGGAGWARDAKSELFLLAAANMVSEQTFYETADDRDERFEDLIHAVVKEDPEWVARFVPYLRDVMNMRSASVVMAAEYVKAGGTNGRSVIAAALQRADEPGEMIAYWRSRHGRALPMPVKRGVADAVRRLYNESNALRYDGIERQVRMGDVIDIVHPKPVADWQSALFKYLLDKRHGHVAELDEGLALINADVMLRAMPEADRRDALVPGTDAAQLLALAGWSWERLSGWLPGKGGASALDKEAWEAVIPNLGYMALLRNLRNFDQAGVSDDVANMVAAKLSDPDLVEKSRQFPIRFYSAFREIGSLRWAHALETALNLSLLNVPSLRGRTLVVVDCSGSMANRMSGRSQRTRSEIAGLFGAAIAKTAESATLVRFGSASEDITSVARQPVLRAIDVFAPNMGGTYTYTAINRHFDGHDRVVVLTDGQADDSGGQLPPVPVYTWDLAGYRYGHTPSDVTDRYTFAGLNDAAFRLVPMIESAKDGTWPF